MGYRCLAIMFGTFITTIVDTQCWLVQGLIQCLQIGKQLFLMWCDCHHMIMIVTVLIRLSNIIEGVHRVTV